MLLREGETWKWHPSTGLIASPRLFVESRSKFDCTPTPRTKIKQKDTEIYVIQREEITLHLPVTINLNNQSVYLTLQNL